MPGPVAGTVAEEGVKRTEDTFKKLTHHHHGVRAASRTSCMRGECRDHGLQVTTNIPGQVVAGHKLASPSDGGHG